MLFEARSKGFVVRYCSSLSTILMHFSILSGSSTQRADFNLRGVYKTCWLCSSVKEVLDTVEDILFKIRDSENKLFSYLVLGGGGCFVFFPSSALCCPPPLRSSSPSSNLRISCSVSQKQTGGQSFSQTMCFFCPWCKATRLKGLGHTHQSRVMDFSDTAVLAEPGDTMQICILFECVKVHLPS